MSCSPGEVVVFQCVEWLKGYLQDRLPQQNTGKEEEEEEEGEDSAGRTTSVDKTECVYQLPRWCVCIRHQFIASRAHCTLLPW